MKRLIFVMSVFFLTQNILYSQVSIIRVHGGPNVTKLTMGVAVNDNSSLKRDWIVLNDAKCPVKLDSTVGIKTTYNEPSYRFRPQGKLVASEPIVAYEIHHVLYDVFGEHMKTLNNSEVIDVNGL